MNNSKLIKAVKTGAYVGLLYVAMELGGAIGKARMINGVVKNLVDENEFNDAIAEFNEARVLLPTVGARVRAGLVMLFIEQK